MPANLLSRVWLCATPMDCSLPGSSVHGNLQAGTLSGLPFPSPGDLPNRGIQPASPVSRALAGRVFTTSATWEAPSGQCAIVKFRSCRLPVSLSVAWGELEKSVANAPGSAFLP